MQYIIYNDRKRVKNASTILVPQPDIRVPMLAYILRHILVVSVLAAGTGAIKGASISLLAIANIAFLTNSGIMFFLINCAINNIVSCFLALCLS